VFFSVTVIFTEFKTVSPSKTDELKLPC
jgi:hypothetical protein